MQDSRLHSVLDKRQMIIALDGKDFNNGLFRLAVPPRQLPRGSSPKKCFHGS